MFLQQGVMLMIVRRLLPFLDLRNLQDDHGVFALEQSIVREEATIDLEDASNSVFQYLVEFLAPKEWYTLFDTLRSPSASAHGEVIELSMVSTMGNAFTFPLETLVFYCIAVGCFQVVNDKKGFFDLSAAKNIISVYGDDIFIPNSCVSLLKQVFRRVGIVFNDEKTFFGNDPFRESCGHDYFAGYNVRPFFIKAPESTRRDFLEPWLYSIMNGYFKAIISFAGNLRFVYKSDFLNLMYCIFERYNLRLKIVPAHFPASSGVLGCYWDHRVARIFGRDPVSPFMPDKHGTVKVTYLRYESRTLNIRQEGATFKFVRDRSSSAFDKQWYWYTLRSKQPEDVPPTKGLLRDLALFYLKKDRRSVELKYVDKGKGGYKTARVFINIGHVV